LRLMADIQVCFAQECATAGRHDEESAQHFLCARDCGAAIMRLCASRIAWSISQLPLRWTQRPIACAETDIDRAERPNLSPRSGSIPAIMAWTTAASCRSSSVRSRSVGKNGLGPDEIADQQANGCRPRSVTVSRNAASANARCRTNHALVR
jgi:hypothetical protein